tara:strand:+ start:14306 stop:14479 length:174 start_codon:yes stop_codon:yes gene_type:complete
MPTLKEKLETRFPDENWSFMDDDTCFNYFRGQYHLGPNWPSGLPVWSSDEIKAFLES